MFFFDPTYLLFILPGVALSLWASFRTKSAFRTYSKVPCARQFTGALLHERPSAGGAVWPALLVSAGATLQG